MLADRKIEQLRRMPMLRACRDSELRRLAGAGETVDVAAGEVLQADGAPVRHFHLVLRVFILGKREFTGALDDCPAFRDAILRSLSRRLAGADRISPGERRLSLV